MFSFLFDGFAQSFQLVCGLAMSTPGSVVFLYLICLELFYRFVSYNYHRQGFVALVAGSKLHCSRLRRWGFRPTVAICFANYVWYPSFPVVLSDWMGFGSECCVRHHHQQSTSQIDLTRYRLASTNSSPFHYWAVDDQVLKVSGWARDFGQSLGYWNTTLSLVIIKLSCRTNFVWPWSMVGLSIVWCSLFLLLQVPTLQLVTPT